MKTKSDLTVAIKQEYSQWQKVLRKNGSSTEIRDVLIHLGAWLEITLARLEAARQGGDPVMPDWPEDLDHNSDSDLDAINAWIRASRTDLTYRQARDMWEQRFQQMLALTESIPEEDWFVTGKYPWLPGYTLAAAIEGSLEHHREHWE